MITAHGTKEWPHLREVAQLRGVGLAHQEGVRLLARSLSQAADSVQRAPGAGHAQSAGDDAHDGGVLGALHKVVAALQQPGRIFLLAGAWGPEPGHGLILSARDRRPVAVQGEGHERAQQCRAGAAHPHEAALHRLHMIWQLPKATQQPRIAGAIRCLGVRLRRRGDPVLHMRLHVTLWRLDEHHFRGWEALLEHRLCPQRLEGVRVFLVDHHHGRAPLLACVLQATRVMGARVSARDGNMCAPCASGRASRSAAAQWPTSMGTQGNTSSVGRRDTRDRQDRPKCTTHCASTCEAATSSTQQLEGGRKTSKQRQLFASGCRNAPAERCVGQHVEAGDRA